MLEWFEKKYTCSGICSPGLFYYSLDVSEGIPDTSCLLHLKSEITDSLTGIGVCAIICGILMCLTSLVQYSLWCKYED